VNLHRFLAYTVVACWIGLTAVTVGTALQWAAASSMSEVKVQRAYNAQKEASASSASNTQLGLNLAPQDQEVMAQLRRSNDRYVAKAEAASEAMGDALNLEKIERKQFWWEFAVWGGFTLLASALLAERRDGDERASSH
jgi:hypothetical protein